MWSEMVLVTCGYLSRIPEKAWEKPWKESEYVLSKEVLRQVM